MKETISYALDIGGDRYLKEVYLNPAFSRALHLEGLGFESFEITGSSNTSRDVAATPRIDAPGFVQKVMGRSQAYTERGHLASDGVWRYEVKPGAAGGRITIKGALEILPRGGDACDVRFTLEASARIPLVGKKIEAFIIRQFADNLRKQEAFTRRWIAEKYG